MTPRVTNAAWLAVALCSAAWFVGMFVLHRILWVPWIFFGVALTLLTALLLTAPEKKD